MIKCGVRSVTIPSCSRPQQHWGDPPVTRQSRTLTLAGELSESRCHGRKRAVLRTSPIPAERIYPKSCRGKALVVFRAGKRDVENGCLGAAPAAARAPIPIAATGAAKVLPNPSARASPDGP